MAIQYAGVPQPVFSRIYSYANISRLIFTHFKCIAKK